MCFCLVAVLMAVMIWRVTQISAKAWSELVRPEIAERLEQADHALLHDVLVICADQKVGSRLGSDEVLVLVKQIFRCVRVSLLRKQGDFLIGHAVKVVVHGFLPAHSSPRRMRSKISR